MANIKQRPANSGMANIPTKSTVMSRFSEFRSIQPLQLQIMYGRSRLLSSWKCSWKTAEVISIEWKPIVPIYCQCFTDKPLWIPAGGARQRISMKAFILLPSSTKISPDQLHSTMLQVKSARRLMTLSRTHVAELPKQRCSLSAPNEA
jgi:hypothetical protein